MCSFAIIELLLFYIHNYIWVNFFTTLYFSNCHLIAFFLLQISSSFESFTGLLKATPNRVRYFIQSSFLKIIETLLSSVYTGNFPSNVYHATETYYVVVKTAWIYLVSLLKHSPDVFMPCTEQPLWGISTTANRFKVLKQQKITNS